PTCSTTRPRTSSSAARRSGASGRTTAVTPATIRASRSPSTTASRPRTSSRRTRSREPNRSKEAVMNSTGNGRTTRALLALGLILTLGAGGSAALAQAPPKADVDAAMKAAFDKYKDLKQGKNADYIPALAKVDSNIYGIALVGVDGSVNTMGDIKSE